jgi:hypothetical protein
MNSSFKEKIVEDTAAIGDSSITPEQYSSLYDVINHDCERLAKASTRYFVVGNFDTEDGCRHRVERVESSLSKYPSTEAFLLDDIDHAEEVWENWYVKFRVFYNRSDYVVGVFEDNDGGHELEVGEVDNDDLQILKRDYFTDDGEVDTETEHERYDGMLAKLFETIDDRVYHWTLGGVHGHDNLDRATRRVAEATR